MNAPSFLLAVLLGAAMAETARPVDLPNLLDAAAGKLPPGLRRDLTAQPSPYLVKAHDVGVPTDVHIDIPWHLLDKEKDPRFPLPHRGQLGLVNAHTDVNWLIGLGLDGRPVDFSPPRAYIDHLINLAVQEVRLDGVRAYVLFLPTASDTILAVIELHNPTDRPCTVRVESVCAKPPVESTPADTWGYGIHATTGKLLSVDFDADHRVATASYEEWARDTLRPIGSLLCTMTASQPPTAFRTAMDAQTQPAGGPGPSSPPGASQAVLVFDVPLAPGQSSALYVALNMHRFGPQRFQTEHGFVLYPAETPDEARRYSRQAAAAALDADYASLVRESFRWYERVPVLQLPRASWATDFYCALELPRANTWSAQADLPQPWYTFCRAHGHEPYGWWSYGMHGHEHLSTFVVNLTQPALSQGFLRGHFQNQAPDGFIPYGVNHVRRNVHEGLATCPLLMTEAWNAYCWSGDRAFLQEAYQAGSRYAAWWRSPARTRPGVPLQHWRDYLETVRDDGDLATWAATDKAQNQEALDLNCYLLNEEQTLAAMAGELGHPDEAASWQRQADERRATMRDRLWHTQDGVYYGKDLIGDRWARVMDISTFFPMLSGLATPDQAARLVELLHDPQAFGTDYPVATLAVKHMPPRDRGQSHWRGANWVEMSWLVVQGLKRYGYYDQAARVAEANCRMVFDTLEKTGHFREYFNSLTGAPTDLTDYIWTSIPAIMIVDVFLGIRPTAAGVEVLPALPAGWDAASIDNLSIRGLTLSVRVRRDPAAKDTTATVNGSPQPVVDQRGLLVPWNALPAQAQIEIVQPPAIPWPLPLSAPSAER